MRKTKDTEVEVARIEAELTGETISEVAIRKCREAIYGKDPKASKDHDPSAQILSEIKSINKKLALLVEIAEWLQERKAKRLD